MNIIINAKLKSGFSFFYFFMTKKEGQNFLTCSRLFDGEQIVTNPIFCLCFRSVHREKVGLNKCLQFQLANKYLSEVLLHEQPCWVIHNTERRLHEWKFLGLREIFLYPILVLV